MSFARVVDVDVSATSTGDMESVGSTKLRVGTNADRDSGMNGEH